MPGSAGDAGATSAGIGAVVLDGYSRAFAVDLARTIRSAAALGSRCTARFPAPIAPARRARVRSTS